MLSSDIHPGDQERGKKGSAIIGCFWLAEQAVLYTPDKLPGFSCRVNISRRSYRPSLCSAQLKLVKRRNVALPEVGRC